MDDSFESVIDKQLSEISDAKTLHSDIDLAFNLQMEEAITASLSLDPSSSAFNSPLKIASFVSVTNNVDEDDVLHDYTALLLEDIERFDQERRDREACENLMREMREDLDRRIHDQNLANEILNIPDDEWENYGDHYHRPYGDDGGSSSSFPLINELALVNSESFKVYCKGLKSKEMIREMNVVVGGVGVAICDSRDNAIFEVSKGLEEDSCGKGKETWIVSGMTFVFFHIQVTGRVQPIQNRISTLVNQITWSTESGKGKKSSKETCVICFEDTDVGQMFCVDRCLHRYCFSCMKQHVEVKLLNGMEARCPHEGCKSEVSIDACEKFLDPKLVEIMIQRKKEASIAVPEKVYCPYVKCSSLMSKNEVLEYTNAFVVGAENLELGNV
ncbi:hypothetical protein GH714_014007 [Hevea brasiliensis]|uniref:RING-type domain-containing protein n=1 Tax=Hevea brasiliensis TaxID=3981 RepID=A0A6A6LGH4_HEVBR|nr:hypothetical protein GH714_014007 [Hevea brasiliensis]